MPETASLSRHGLSAGDHHQEHFSAADCATSLQTLLSRNLARNASRTILLISPHRDSRGCIRCAATVSPLDIAEFRADTRRSPTRWRRPTTDAEISSRGATDSTTLPPVPRQPPWEYADSANRNTHMLWRPGNYCRLSRYFRCTQRLTELQRQLGSAGL